MSLRPEGSGRVKCCLKPDKNDSEDRQGSPRPHKGSSTTTYSTRQSPVERLRRRAEGETHTPKKETQGSYPQLGTPKAQASSSSSLPLKPRLHILEKP